ncbi:MFS transporter [Salarchaeum sp. JOR-1]|uniref:MFS transporter n=1 Tax=Salarchaeum sp. JOR-1 TaxID=2599399 RepID=UPI00119834EA|nr:MFS transporter [Salarchaeum sp. JOR-1]QDX41211.1 MFS transporter [Salarchaeum sp. JOR-1]
MGVFDTDRRIIVLALARMADAIGNSFLIVVLPLYIEHLVGGGESGVFVELFGLSTTLSLGLATGVVLSLFGFLNSFAQPFTGRWSDRVGKRKIFIIAGLAILTVTNLAYVLAGSYFSLFGIRALQGLGVAFTVPATVALVNELSSATSRGESMGVFNTFRLLGFGMGPIAAGTFVHLYGYNAAFAFAAGAALVATLLVYALVEDAEETEASAGEDLSIEVLNSANRGVLDPVFTLGLASLFMAIGIALLAAIETRVNARLDQGSFLFGVEFAAFVLAQVLVQVPVGRLSDRYGRRPFILLGLAILAPATLVQGFVTTPAEMITARFVQGVAGAMVFAPGFALAGDLARHGDSGTKLSVLTMSFGLGTAIGPLAAGVLYTFDYAAPFVFGGLLAVLGFVLVYTQVAETVDPDAGRAEGAAPQD